jgi:serine/threonine protein kinase
MAYEIKKQIGKGSFSKVYLCQYNQVNFFSLEEQENVPFIMKEINLDDLVKKYKKGSKKKIKITHGSSDVNLTITPYSRCKTKMVHHSEQDYYYSRLKDLVESEISILKILQHDYIIRFYGYENETENMYKLKMEYSEYGDIHTILKKNNISLVQSYRNIFNGFNNDFIELFLKDVSNALEYLDENHIIHRDIKLHNILLFKDKLKGTFKFKLCDFGFACYDMSVESMQREMSQSKLSSICINMDYVLKEKYYKLCGTPYYMAPEIILNMNRFDKLINVEDRHKQTTHMHLANYYDNKSDLWSVGICIYELIFNALPYSDLYTYSMNDITSLAKVLNVNISMNFEKRLEHQINNKRFIRNDIKSILKQLLKIHPEERMCIQDLIHIIQHNHIINISDEFVDIVHEELQSLSIHQIQNKQSTIIPIIQINEVEDTMESTVDIPNDTKEYTPNDIKDHLQNKTNKAAKESWFVLREEDNKYEENKDKNNVSSWFKMSLNKSMPHSVMKMSIDNSFKNWLLK